MTVSDSTQTWISNPCFGVKFITTAKHILRLFTFWYTGSPTILFFGKRNIKIPTGFPLTWALNACWAWEIVGFDHYLHFSTFASHSSRWCFNYRPDMYSEQINGENKLLSVKLETLRYLVAKTAWSCDEYERVTDRRTDGRTVGHAACDWSRTLAELSSTKIISKWCFGGFLDAALKVDDSVCFCSFAV